MRQPEKDIENACLDYLELRGILAWKNQSVGVYDASRGVYRKPRNRHHRCGVSDILGIYRGYPLAVEVKSERGRVSEDQAVFIAQFTRAGGLACVVRSVDDLADRLAELDKIMDGARENI